MFRISRLLRAVGALATSAVMSLSAHAALTTQLGFLIDASGSIGATNFGLIKSGYAAALAGLPTDGSLEVTIYTFNNTANQIVAPTVINSAAALNAVIAAVNGIVYTTGQATYTGAGITAIANAMTGSANFSTGLASIINMSTDGAPNDNTGNPQQTAINAAIAAEAAGIDALTIEAVASNSTTIDAMRDIVFSPLAGPCANCGTVLPDGSTPPNPMTSNPWVLVVNDFNDFDRAIDAKIQAIVNPTPEPGALALVALGLAALGVSQRNRKA